VILKPCCIKIACSAEKECYLYRGSWLKSNVFYNNALSFKVNNATSLATKITQSAN